MSPSPHLIRLYLIKLSRHLPFDVFMATDTLMRRVPTADVKDRPRLLAEAREEIATVERKFRPEPELHTKLLELLNELYHFTFDNAEPTNSTSQDFAQRLLAIWPEATRSSAHQVLRDLKPWLDRPSC